MSVLRVVEADETLRKERVLALKVAMMAAEMGVEPTSEMLLEACTAYICTSRMEPERRQRVLRRMLASLGED